MNKRAVVTSGTGDFYCKNLDRLLNSFRPSCNIYKKTKDGYWHVPKEHTKSIDLLCWYDCFPEGSRPHEESPYGFKVFAIKSALEKGYTSVLWLDSAAYSVKEDISPIFEKIEKEGYYAMSHIDPLENWIGDEARNYWFVNDEDLKGLNLPSGTCYGFNLGSIVGTRLFADILTYEKAGMFKSRSAYHRHDESILALLLRGYNLPVFTFDPLFQSDDERCVIKSGG